MSKQQSTDDDELLKGLLAGASHAYRQLLRIVDTEIKPLWKYKAPHLSNEELEDALLDAVSAFLQKVGAYNAAARQTSEEVPFRLDRVRPLLHTISHHKIVDLVRRKVFTKDDAVYERMTNVEDWDTLDTLKKLETSIVNDRFPYISDSDFEAFRACLSTSEKAVFDCLCESKDDQTIAKELELTLSTVNNIKSAVKQKLKKFLGLDPRGLR